jgi:hypothetical protein
MENHAARSHFAADHLDHLAAATGAARRWASFWTILRSNSRRSRSNSAERGDVLTVCME